MKILKLGLTLAIVSCLSAGLLSYVYGLTEPIIEEANIEKRKAQLESIYSNGETFEELELDLEDYEDIAAVFKVEKDNNIEGYVYQMSVNGYGGKVVYLIALDKSGIYKGYEAIDVSTETKGFGSRVGTDEMKKNIVNKEIGSNIDTLTGATISSTAVINGIKEAVQHYQEVLS